MKRTFSIVVILLIAISVAAWKRGMLPACGGGGYLVTDGDCTNILMADNGDNLLP